MPLSLKGAEWETPEVCMGENFSGSDLAEIQKNHVKLQYEKLN